MLSHIYIGVTDFERAFSFYSIIMDVLGLPLRFKEPEKPWAGWKPANTARPLFLIGHPYNGENAAAGNGQMVALLAPNRDAVDKCYAAAIANGGQSEGSPSLRPQYHPDYYGAYFRDPDGNKLCICCHDPAPQRSLSKSPVLLLRPADQDDLKTLWHFLAIAAYEPNSISAKAVPVVALHLAGWCRPVDFGVIAEHGGIAIGAAWARQFSKDEEPVFYIDERTPEVSIGVAENFRGRGVGASLLGALRLEAKRRGVGLCLNVRDTNPAIGLYQRIGFQRVHGTEVKNRVGGFSFGMILTD